MSHSSRTEPQDSRRARPGPLGDYYRAVRADLAAAWVWAVAPLKWLFEATVRDGIPPPTTFEGLPPGQFPPIDAIKDELLGRTGHDRSAARPFERDLALGARIPSRRDDRKAF